MRSAKWALPVAAIALALACVLAPAQALAHGGNPNYRSEINSFQPPLPSGVSIEVLDYDSYLQLIDQHGHEVLLYGYDGEPYARIEKDGTVQVNQRSPATYLNDSRFAEETVPASADAKAAPEWKTVDSSGTFIWHDHRMHYMSRSLPPSIEDTAEKQKVFNYTIPMSVDGQNTVLHGTLWWVGSQGTSKLPFLIAAIVIVLGGGALVVWIRRRRDRDRDDDDGGGSDEPKPTEPVGEAW
ncbi:MAG: hypothetical protein BGO11_08225 [Solirubrobacterales bacterium 70-9]|nr:MAG: hypothetical protein BGO11_08225 [Solirubrobacterales bacterium 70-9]